MARYDRIARIDPPPRDECFNGWLTLRDLEGREREPELGRRARLHFLALRPVRRLLAQGLDGPEPASLDDQIEGVREHVERLPSQDGHRDTLTRYLEDVGGRSPAGLVRATLDVGAAAEAAGYRFAAEEFYRTALELAETHGLDDRRVVALRHLGRVQRDREEWAAARESLHASADLADRLGDVVEWARSMEALAAVELRAGDTAGAREALDRIPERGEDGAPDSVRAIAAAGRCALELALGNYEAALDAGWIAATTLPPQDEARNGVLLNMAGAFRHLGLGSAAGSCYEIVVRWGTWPEHRLEARLEHALAAAEAGDAERFAARRAVVLAEVDHVDRPLEAMMHLGLGKGALLTGDTQQARGHLREAIVIARDTGADQVLERAEELLQALERQASGLAPAPRSPSTDARAIAERVEALAGG